MISFFRHLMGWIIGFFRSRQDLMLENLALREQLLALKAKCPRRRLSTAHKLFWITLLRLWSGWKQPLVLVTPRTVVAWHRAGFRLYWRWQSRARRVGGKFGNDVVSFTREMGSLPVRTAFCSPWQNAVAERWVGSCRRDLLDHAIILHKRHLKRLMAEYVR